MTKYLDLRVFVDRSCSCCYHETLTAGLCCCWHVLLRKKLAAESRWRWFTTFVQGTMFTVVVCGLTFIISYIISYRAGRRIYLSQHCPAQ
jgi:hypothetical protein